MATKKAGKVRVVDNRKLQEIIGRVLTDEKFANKLARSPVKTLAEYELDKPTLALVQKAIKLRGELQDVLAEIHEQTGIEVQSI